MSLKSKAYLLYLNILIACLLYPEGFLYGQNYTIRSFTTADGLPHNNVRAIARDSSGFIWVGSWDGLSRYDGHEFRNYFHEPDDSTSIPYFSIQDLLVDRSNNLWILTDTRELVHYNRNTDNFSTLKSVDGIPLDFINNISVDQSGNLMILGRDRIIIKDPEKPGYKIIKLFGSNNKPYPVEKEKNYFEVSEDSEIWLIGDTIKEFRKTADREFLLYREYGLIRKTPKLHLLFDFYVWFSFYKSPKGSKWLFSNEGLFKLDEAAGVFKEYSDVIPGVDFTGKDFFYWGKWGDGIYYYNSKSQILTHIPDNKTRWASEIMPGDKNSFWFSHCTSRGVALGISMVAFIPGYFTNTLIISSDSTSPAVYSVIMDKDKNIWTGIRGYDHIVQYRTDGTVLNKDFLPPERISSAGYIRSMIPVRNGIWIGYYANFLQFYEYKSGKFITQKAEGRSFRAITVNADGNIYIGTDNLSVYYPATGKTEILWPRSSADGMFRLYADTAGIVWAGMSESRLLRYNTITGESKIIKVTQGTSNIEDVISGDDGDLWLALLGKGVCRYNTVKGTFKYYTTSRGLSNNTTYCLLRDKEGHIWVSTNHGISMIRPESDHIRTFGETDGIAISEFNSGAKCLADDGEFIFGGMGGFVRFYPDSIALDERKTNTQRILLTDLRISGGPKYLPETLNETDTIILEKGENNFHLFFSSTDFVNSDKTIFRYRLTGVNRKWTETGPENRDINYSNLMPGWYHLIIEATDQNGDWTTSRQFTIRIKPSFYQTRIFRILTPLIIFLIISFSIILYIRQIKQKERSKQDELKLQSLRSQMNPHFVFNALNSINYFISNNDKLSANRYIADFSRLIRGFLSNMGFSFIPLEDEINSVMDYLRIEHLRFSDKFDYKLDTSEIKNISELEVCPGIVGPFIENAIWHGLRALENRKGQIYIRFMQSGTEGLKCIIEDDGIGRNASLKSKGHYENHKPKGISIIEERLEITGKLRKTNYLLEITDLYPERNETGTRVEVDIPARKIKLRKS